MASAVVHHIMGNYAGTKRAEVGLYVLAVGIHN